MSLPAYAPSIPPVFYEENDPNLCSATKNGPKNNMHYHLMDITLCHILQLNNLHMHWSWPILKDRNWYNTTDLLSSMSSTVLNLMVRQFCFSLFYSSPLLWWEKFFSSASANLLKITNTLPKRFLISSSCPIVFASSIQPWIKQFKLTSLSDQKKFCRNNFQSIIIDCC